MFLVFAAVFPLFPLQAADCELIRHTLDTNWKNIHKTSRGYIYKPRTPRDKSAAATALVKWPFRPDRLFKVVWDYNQFTQFIPGVSHSAVVHREGQQAWVYQRLTFPAPVRDRHYIMVTDHSASQPQNGHYAINWHLDSGYPIPIAGDASLPDKFQGCWDIRPTPQGGLDAIYSVEIEPGGLIPRWLAQQASQRYLIDLMDALYLRLLR